MIQLTSIARRWLPAVAVLALAGCGAATTPADTSRPGPTPTETVAAATPTDTPPPPSHPQIPLCRSRPRPCPNFGHQRARRWQPPIRLPWRWLPAKYSWLSFLLFGDRPAAQWRPSCTGLRNCMASRSILPIWMWTTRPRWNFGKRWAAAPSRNFTYWTPKAMCYSSGLARCRPPNFRRLSPRR